MAAVFSTLLTFLLVLVCVFSQSDWADGGWKEIEAGSNTKGEWHDWEFCPNNMYVYGMQMRVEWWQGKGKDSTGLNALRLFCAPLGIYQQSASIESYAGLWGSWGKGFQCKQSLMQGIKVRNQAEQGDKADDAALTGVRMICSNGQVIEGTGNTWGDWMEDRKCPKEYAVCGIKVAFHESQGKGDDTALNKIRLGCCRVKLNTCVPKDRWVTLIRCDNSWSDSPSACRYKQEIGTSMSSSEAATLRKEQYLQYSTTAGIDVAGDPYGFKGIFSTSLGKSPVTDFDWTKSHDSGFGEVGSSDAHMTVEPRKIKYLEQLVGTCGAATVRTPVFKFREESPYKADAPTGNARTKSVQVTDSVGEHVPTIKASKDDLSGSKATVVEIAAPANNTSTSNSTSA